MEEERRILGEDIIPGDHRKVEERKRERGGMRGIDKVKRN